MFLKCGVRRADVWFGICFGQGDPLADKEFAELATVIFGPLLAHRVHVRPE